MNGLFNVNTPVNEPVKDYAPGSAERIALEAKLKALSAEKIEIPLIINGEAVKTGNLKDCTMPHDHQHVIGFYHAAGTDETKAAIDACLTAQKEWAAMPWQHRVAIFLKAAELVSTKYRALLNAATMLTQSKNAFQAEIDSTCELTDFLRFNAKYVAEIYSEQPNSTKDTWNRLEYRPLDGFVYAITPFNFTAIAGNLPTAPAMLGNCVIWKPSSTTVYSNYIFMQILIEAGLPKGVINFVPGNSAEITDVCTSHSSLAGIHFTGSTAVFQSLWRSVSENIHQYKSYPRLVGETGGKDYIFADASANIDALAVAMVRGSFEFQGQKCSAASRAYLPKSIAAAVLDRAKTMISELKMGDVANFENFVNAVIDAKAYKKIVSYIEDAQQSEDAEIIAGGTYDDSVGYFIAPTLILAKKPDYVSMREEIFGPVLTVYVYEDEARAETLESLNDVSDYALTGAIFAEDRKVIVELEQLLSQTAGNFYINDKPTGAVVGQQPFGGGRASGTNDKAGSKLNLYRWISARTIKETYCPPTDYRYPFMGK
ncbi:L-glutamate gamma-semialdehyde dehydrogenase [Fusibacter paucivorans]|uniref:L-glutamate gamma-semialdehyde dehydrogenase n=1 Tax=Fusibacter paucivorans TaxID=76009 RepID=A0ABS5PQQ0_9FIRM|nr:L-glutamate gamma-semialdehyde dehydrogenase [Fusibacter paucivorans]MBS7527490.1 L-glutamate gamma-semialdehyde dehydrogenase [Fusibacter paucivorans]